MSKVAKVKIAGLLGPSSPEAWSGQALRLRCASLRTSLGGFK